MFVRKQSPFYLKTKEGLEVDLILQKGHKKILIEIKSTHKTLPQDLKHLKTVRKEFSKSKAFLISLDKIARKQEGIFILHWQEALKKIFNLK